MLREAIEIAAEVAAFVIVTLSLITVIFVVHLLVA